MTRRRKAELFFAEPDQDVFSGYGICMAKSDARYG